MHTLCQILNTDPFSWFLQLKWAIVLVRKLGGLEGGYKGLEKKTVLPHPPWLHFSNSVIKKSFLLKINQPQISYRILTPGKLQNYTKAFDKKGFVRWDRPGGLKKYTNITPKSKRIFTKVVRASTCRKTLWSYSLRSLQSLQSSFYFPQGIRFKRSWVYFLY